MFFNILMVMDSVKFVPKELIETTLTLGGRSRQVLVQVVARYSMPSIIDTLRINIATSWNLVWLQSLWPRRWDWGNASSLPTFLPYRPDLR